MPRNKEEETLKIGFLALKTRADVREFFQIKESFLNALAIRNRSKLYKNFSIKKRSGDDRIISAPIPYLKSIQKKVSRCLYLIYKQKAPAHGFARKRGILSNAKQHEIGKIIFNLDLENFFPTINFGRVRGMFMKSPYNLSEGVATTLAQICCDDHGLPQGSPTSPIISNMVCARLDNEIQRIAIKHHFIYTRYADDITLSTTHKSFPAQVVNADKEPGTELEKTILDNGFIINGKKTKLRDKNQRQKITGLVVNKFPNVQRSFVRDLRSLIYIIKKHGLVKAQKIFEEKKKTKKKLIKVLIGKLNFLKHVRGEKNLIYQKLANGFESATGRPPKYYLGMHEKIRAAVWTLECDTDRDHNGKDYHQGTAFNLKDVGIITCKHVLCPNIKIFKAEAPEKKYAIENLSRESDLDLAIIKLKDDPKIDPGFSLERGESINLKQQGTLFLAGFPSYAPGNPVTIVKTEMTSRRRRNMLNMITIRDTPEGGNSGGPLLDDTERVVGIISHGNSNDNSANQAIPVETLEQIK